MQAFNKDKLGKYTSFRLKYLLVYLGNNEIGSQGMKYLVRCSFHNLQRLMLGNFREIEVISQ